MPDKSAWLWTWFMALLATATLEFAAVDGESAFAAAISVAIVATIVGLGNWFARTWLARWASLDYRMFWVLGLAGLALHLEVIARIATGTMWPLELLLLAGFRNVVLALAIFAHDPVAQRQCNVLSTFLIIFASAVASQLWVQGLVILFTISGIWWLMGNYWHSLQDRLTASTSRDLPRQWSWLLPLLIVLCLLALPAGSGPLRAVAGFMPSSGGTHWYSEAARSGVGDGDALIAGTENIRSFAPIEDAPFLSSHEPSLYDLFDDTYNEPVRNTEQDRAIALPKELGSKQQEHHLAKSQQASRQFSTLRENGQRKTGAIQDRASDAILYVQGRTPLHLKLEVFDRFDGVEWHPEPLTEREPTLSVETLHDRPWLRIPVAPGPEIYASPESHAVKIVRLDTNHVPAPTQLLGVHIDQLNRADFFAWAQPSVIRMERNQLPSQTAIHLHSRVVAPDLCCQQMLILNGRADAYQQFGTDFHSEQIRKLASHWAKGSPTGWPQITAIVNRLRSEYILDREARPPAECRHTAAHFLLTAKRGPDYQFASAAACLLRSLGYSCRLVSGFYAAPEKYDSRSRHTPVMTDDVHVWVEVFAGRDHWIPIEPTPGYELLAPPPSLLEQLKTAVVMLGQTLLRNGWWLSACLIAGTVVLSHRRRLADMVATCRWKLRRSRNARSHIQATSRLMDHRLRRAGLTRPGHLTLSRWLTQLANEHPTIDRSALVQIRSLMDWAAYAPADSGDNIPACQRICQQLESEWNWTRLTQHPSASRRNHPSRPLSKFSNFFPQTGTAG